jgi:hypothetical protein
MTLRPPHPGLEGDDRDKSENHAGQHERAFRKAPDHNRDPATLPRDGASTVPSCRCSFHGAAGHACKMSRQRHGYLCE